MKKEKNREKTREIKNRERMIRGVKRDRGKESLGEK